MNPIDRILELEFEDNQLAAALYGQNNEHLSLIESKLNVTMTTRGNQLTIAGLHDDVQAAQRAIDALWDRLETGGEIELTDVKSALRIATSSADTHAKDLAMEAFTKAPKKAPKKGAGGKTSGNLTPRSPAQAKYLELMNTHELTFGIGPAGTGKTYLAVAKGVELLLNGSVERLIFSRPAVEAGEQLGFLPGDLRDKIDPYLRPIYDALNDRLPADKVVKLMAEDVIEIAPLAFMRGRTLADAFVVVDEAQNTTSMQMKMILTRLGEGSRMVINGDISQTDLPRNVKSGLREAVRLLGDIPDIAVMRFTADDVVRHHLVGKIIKAYARENEE